MRAVEKQVNEGHMEGELENTEKVEAKTIERAV